MKRFQGTAGSKPVTKQQVRAMLVQNVEQKWITRDLAALAPSVGAWNEIDTSNIGQGTTLNTRVGSSVVLTSLSVVGVIAQGSAQSALDDAYNVIRIVVGLYTAGPASSTPLLDAAALISTPILREAYTRGRLLKKYYDAYVPLQVTCLERAGGDGYCPGLKMINLHFTLNEKVTYGTDAATYPDKRLMIAFISDSTAVVNPGFVAGYTTCHFTDS